MYEQNKDKTLHVKSGRPCLSKEEFGQGFNSTRLRTLDDNFLAMTNPCDDLNSLYTSREHSSNFLTSEYWNLGATIDPRFVIANVGESYSLVNGN